MQTIFSIMKLELVILMIVGLFIQSESVAIDYEECGSGYLTVTTLDIEPMPIYNGEDFVISGGGDLEKDLFGGHYELEISFIGIKAYEQDGDFCELDGVECTVGAGENAISFDYAVELDDDLVIPSSLYQFKLQASDEDDALLFCIEFDVEFTGELQEEAFYLGGLGISVVIVGMSIVLAATTFFENLVASTADQLSKLRKDQGIITECFSYIRSIVVMGMMTSKDMPTLFRDFSSGFAWSTLLIDVGDISKQETGGLCSGDEIDDGVFKFTNRLGIATGDVFITVFTLWCVLIGFSTVITLVVALFCRILGSNKKLSQLPSLYIGFILRLFIFSMSVLPLVAVYQMSLPGAEGSYNIVAIVSLSAICLALIWGVYEVWLKFQPDSVPFHTRYSCFYGDYMNELRMFCFIDLCVQVLTGIFLVVFACDEKAQCIALVSLYGAEFLLALLLRPYVSSFLQTWKTFYTFIKAAQFGLVLAMILVDDTQIAILLGIISIGVSFMSLVIFSILIIGRLLKKICRRPNKEDRNDCQELVDLTEDEENDIVPEGSIQSLPLDHNEEEHLKLRS